MFIGNKDDGLFLGGGGGGGSFLLLEHAFLR